MSTTVIQVRRNTHIHMHARTHAHCVSIAVENLHYHGGQLPSNPVTSNRVSLSQLCVCLCVYVYERETESLSLWVCVSNSWWCVSSYLVYSERRNTGQTFIWWYSVRMHACVFAVAHSYRSDILSERVCLVLDFGAEVWFQCCFRNTLGKPCYM